MTDSENRVAEISRAIFTPNAVSNSTSLVDYPHYVYDNFINFRFRSIDEMKNTADLINNSIRHFVEITIYDRDNGNRSAINPFAGIQIVAEFKQYTPSEITAMNEYYNNTKLIYVEPNYE